MPETDSVLSDSPGIDVARRDVFRLVTSSMKRLLKKMLTIVFGALGLLVLLLLLFQGRLIYYPRGYAESFLRTVDAEPLSFTTSQGRQVAWLTPKVATESEHVWLVFCGNGTVALDLEGVCVSSGPACSSGASTPSHVLTAMGVEPALATGSIRVSVGWGTTDAEIALGYLKRFGSVTVLNGHIHQTVRKIEGNVTFHTAMSTAFPQHKPDPAAKPGPMKVDAAILPTVLGITEVNYVESNHSLAVVDSTLG